MMQRTYEEKRQRFKTDDAMVEVTVKLKKRNKGRKPKDDDIFPHKAGSWGDLLLKQKRVASQTIVTHSGDQGAPIKTCIDRRIKDQESQTSVLLLPPTVSQSAPLKTPAPESRKKSLGRNSEVLPVKRLENASAQTQLPAPSVAAKKESDGEDNLSLLNELKKLSVLEKENASLKYDTAKLMEQVQKSKTERQEYIKTIKELYELAEVLRHENVILIGTHEEHRTLQEKLLEALTENQVLKKHLDELSTRIAQTSIDKPKGDEIRQFWKVRDVIKEVKTVIAEEIDELQQVNGRGSPKVDDSDIMDLFSRTKDSKKLDDSNYRCDNEIQNILSNNNNKEKEDQSEIRSSTQYLDVQDGEDDFSGSSRNFVPSP